MNTDLWQRLDELLAGHTVRVTTCSAIEVTSRTRPATACRRRLPGLMADMRDDARERRRPAGP